MPLGANSPASAQIVIKTTKTGGTLSTTLIQSIPVSPAVTAHLGREAGERYSRELAARARDRKITTIRTLVVKLDELLLLNANQRTMLQQSLANQWSESWNHAVEGMVAIDIYMPPVPDSVVTPILTESQRAVWNSVQKTEGFLSGFGPTLPLIAADPLEPRPLRDARLAARAEPPKASR